MARIHGGGHRLLMILLILLLVGVILYLGVVAYVCWQENHVPDTAGNYDAIVVLGAQVKADGTLSVQLQWRLDEAYQAWQTANCPVVTCGAQGADEPAPEGDVMRDYLIGKGIPAEQVFSDPTSFNTRQNIRNAAVILQEQNAARPLIVTSDYHLPRALALAGDEGLTACGVGSPTKPEFWIKNHAREALSWIKYWAQKYLHLPLE